MKVVIFGAGGETGKLTVERARAAGHDVTAFFHSDQAGVDGVRSVSGDTTDPGDVRRAIAGHDAVIDAVGGANPLRDTGLEAKTAKNIIGAMKAEGVRRLVVVSAMGVGESVEQADFWYRHLVLPTLLRGVVADKTHMEEEVDASGLDTVLARPGQLTNAPPSGTLKVIDAPAKGHHTSRADLAQFLVDQLTSDRYVAQAPVVVND